MSNKMGTWESLWALRWNLRSLVVYGAIVVLLATAPIVATMSDHLGLPGAIVVLATLAIAAIASIYAVYTTLPYGRRMRAIRKIGSSLDAPYERRFTLLDGMEPLPFMRLVPLNNRYVAGGFAAERNGRPLGVFARSYTFDEYEATVWRTCAATRVLLDAPLIRVSHGEGLTGQSFPRALLSGLHRQEMESGAFDRRWRVDTRDRRFAVALLDQRMMEWLLTVGDYAFEAGGSWVMVETAGDDVASLGNLLDALDGFVAHLPRAALSMYAPA